jgi:hypothetical protein
VIWREKATVAPLRSWYVTEWNCFAAFRFVGALHLQKFHETRSNLDDPLRPESGFVRSSSGFPARDLARFFSPPSNGMVCNRLRESKRLRAPLARPLLFTESAIGVAAGSWKSIRDLQDR